MSKAEHPVRNEVEVQEAAVPEPRADARPRSSAKAGAKLPVRSMTGFAQVTAQYSDQISFTLSLKSVNHRYLDISMRMPQDTDALEMKLRRYLKERMARGHVDVTLNIERKGGAALEYNRDFVRGFVAAFREAARDYKLEAEPDLNVIFRMPGALNAASRFDADQDGFEKAVLARLETALEKLNGMREQEGASLDRELREAMQRLGAAGEQIGKLRGAVSRAYHEKIKSRMAELVGANADPDRILQEAAMMAERSDIEEEVVRIKTHIAQFLGILSAGGEVGKKLDFLLQELNRETNTLLSKTSGVSGKALNITELGLQMKAEIERAREQVQNLE